MKEQQQQYYEPPYDEQPYDEPEYYEDEPEMISTSQSVQLTCTLSAMLSLFALFLNFADNRSNAVRRTSVQSIGLGAAYLAVMIILWVLNLLFSIFPIVRILIGLIIGIIQIVVTVVFLIVKVKMMFHVYRGYAYTVPVFGEHLRKYE